MRRGDVLVVAPPGEHGKPRPAVVVQTDRLARVDCVVVCLFTSALSGDSPSRLSIAPTPENGLRSPSEVMVEKLFTFRRDRCGPVIGSLPPPVVGELNRRLAFVLGLDE